MAAPTGRTHRGEDPPPLAPVTLTAGALSVLLIESDLREVTWHGTEVVQRLYMAVRDAPWNTIPGQVSERTIVQGPDHFTVTWQQRHRYEDIDLRWGGRVHGTSDGTLTYEMDAEALAAFRYSKIGLNIHHGLAEYNGRGYRARTEAGEVRGTLPDTIAPQLIRDGSLTAMFDHFDDISFALEELTARFTVEGDRFEMQDHRNWSDANYKTYGTPLAYGFPMDISAGERKWQRITLRVAGEPQEQERPAAVRLVPGGRWALPRVGHRIVAAAAPAEKVLGRLRPDHLRVEAEADAGLADRLAAVRTLTGGQTPLELVCLLDVDDPGPGAVHVAEALAAKADDVARLVVLGALHGFSELKGATPAALVAALTAALDARGVSIPVFSGTDQFFTELNRARPDYSGLDGIGFSLNPQVHAADDRSVMQNAGVLPDIARSCRALYPSAEISVGPVHLLGPNGPFPAGPPREGGVPAGHDVRHGALFGAAWTVALLEAAVRAGVEHLTLYDLVGSRGLAPLVETGSGEPGHGGDALPSAARGAYPALWPIARLRYVAGTPAAVALLGAQPDPRCALLGVQEDGRLRLLVANLRGTVTDVRLELAGDSALVSVLDETTVATADLLDESQPAPAATPLTAGVLSLLLRPYAIACVDVDPS